jgi:hypothetical protein
MVKLRRQLNIALLSIIIILLIYITPGLSKLLIISTIAILIMTTEQKITESVGSAETTIRKFPFKKTFYPKDAPIKMMDNLRSIKLKTNNSECYPYNINFKAVMFKNGPLIFPTKCITCFIHDETDYENFDVLGDLFTEEERLKARLVYVDNSPLDEWNDPNFRKKFDSIKDPRELRDAIYNNVKEATQFKPSLMIQTVLYLNTLDTSDKGVVGPSPFRILDISAGWGDRLIGAIALNAADYTAFDPNINLKSGHDEIIKTYEFKNTNIEYIPFEEAKLTRKYNLIFTSPPFFDFEIYTKHPGQSINSYPNFENWCVNFLFKSIEKAWDALDDGGYCVMHITDVNKIQVCEPMCLFMQWKLPKAQYIGCICSKGLAGKPRPLWVFKKGIQNNSLSQKCEKIMSILYNKIYLGIGRAN